MEFAVDETIVHPVHGTGTIVGIEENELVDGFHKYYVIHFPQSRLIVRLPCTRSKDAGLRPTMSEARSAKVMEILQRMPKTLPDDFKERSAVMEELIYSGVPTQIARAVRELTFRSRDQGISLRENKILSETRERLVRELMIATDGGREEIVAAINTALEEAVDSKLSAQAAAA